VRRGPLRQGDHLRRDEGLRIKDLLQGFYCRRSGFGVRGSGFAGSWFSGSWFLVLDDDPRDDARAERNDDAGADRRRRKPLGNGIRQKIEIRNGNGDLNDAISLRLGGGSGQASYPPTPRASRRGCAADTRGGTSAPASRRGSCRRVRADAKWDRA